MKRLFLFISILLISWSAFGQAVTQTGFVGKFSFQSFSAGGSSDVTGTLDAFSDQTNQYFANNIQVADVIWDNQGGRWEVMAVNSSNLLQADVDLRSVNGAGGTPFGVGFVSRETPNMGLSLFVPDNNIGISQQLKSRIESHNMLLIDQYVASHQDSVFTGATAADTTTVTDPTIGDVLVADNGDVGYYDGSSWVISSGGGEAQDLYKPHPDSIALTGSDEVIEDANGYINYTTEELLTNTSFDDGNTGWEASGAGYTFSGGQAILDANSYDVLQQSFTGLDSLSWALVKITWSGRGQIDATISDYTQNASDYYEAEGPYTSYVLVQSHGDADLQIYLYPVDQDTIYVYDVSMRGVTDYFKTNISGGITDQFTERKGHGFIRRRFGPDYGDFLEHQYDDYSNTYSKTHNWNLYDFRRGTATVYQRMYWSFGRFENFLRMTDRGSGYESDGIFRLRPAFAEFEIDNISEDTTYSHFRLEKGDLKLLGFNRISPTQGIHHYQSGTDLSGSLNEYMVGAAYNSNTHELDVETTDQAFFKASTLKDSTLLTSNFVGYGGRSIFQTFRNGLFGNRLDSVMIFQGNNGTDLVNHLVMKMPQSATSHTLRPYDKYAFFNGIPPYAQSLQYWDTGGNPGWLDASSLSGGGSPDGNGIYSGSGNVPDATEATLANASSFAILDNSGADRLRITEEANIAITATTGFTATTTSGILGLTHTGSSGQLIVQSQDERATFQGEEARVIGDTLARMTVGTGDVLVKNDLVDLTAGSSDFATLDGSINEFRVGTHDIVFEGTDGFYPEWKFETPVAANDWRMWTGGVGLTLQNGAGENTIVIANGADPALSVAADGVIRGVQYDNARHDTDNVQGNYSVGDNGDFLKTFDGEFNFRDDADATSTNTSTIIMNNASMQLPSALTNAGKIFIVIANSSTSGGSTRDITVAGGGTIEGNASLTMDNAYEVYALVSNGTEYVILWNKP